MRIFLLVIITLVISGKSLSQENSKYSFAYEHYFLNNSNYNLSNSDFNYIKNFKIKSNHNLVFNYYLHKDKLNYIIGLTYQFYHGDNNNKNDSIITRRMNAFGIVLGIEKSIAKYSYIDLYGVIGWSIINKNFVYSSNPNNEFVISHGPFISINFSIKQRLFKTNKTGTFLKFMINERLIEFSSNFTIGLGLELNFLK